MLETPSFVASGNISPSRFVALSTAQDFTVLQGTDVLVPFGVSQPGTQEAPGTAADSGYAATDGKVIKVYGPGETALLELGGTVTRGDWLKPDANGKGVTASIASATVIYYGARALRSGVSGEKVPVYVFPYPATTA